MMTRNIFLFVVLSVFFMFTACDSMVSNVDAPTTKPKLVVSSFISPNEQVNYVQIQESKPLYTSSSNMMYGYNVISDAIVKIKEGNNSQTLTYNSEYKKYGIQSAAFPIVAGRTYHLEIITAKGAIVTASSTVPAAEVPLVEIVKIEERTVNGTIYRKINFRFRDIQGQGHFYRVSAAFKENFGDIDHYNPLYYDMGDEYTSDVSNDGNYFNFKTGEYISHQFASSKLVIYIGLSDENYFRYHRSIDGFQNDNPFSEPTPIFSNISGGIGVFGAINGRYQIFDLN